MTYISPNSQWTFDSGFTFFSDIAIISLICAHTLSCSFNFSTLTFAAPPHNEWLCSKLLITLYFIILLLYYIYIIYYIIGIKIAILRKCSGFKFFALMFEVFNLLILSWYEWIIFQLNKCCCLSETSSETISKSHFKSNSTISSLLQYIAFILCTPAYTGPHTHFTLQVLLLNKYTVFSIYIVRPSPLALIVTQTGPVVVGVVWSTRKSTYCNI